MDDLARGAGGAEPNKHLLLYLPTCVKQIGLNERTWFWKGGQRCDRNWKIKAV